MVELRTQKEKGKIRHVHYMRRFVHVVYAASRSRWLCVLYYCVHRVRGIFVLCCMGLNILHRVCVVLD